jgi:hypothetical protein
MRIQTEICFIEPCDVDGAVTALRAHSYEIDKIDNLMDDEEVSAVFVYASRDVTAAELTSDVLAANYSLEAELAGIPRDRWAAGGLVLDESRRIVARFGGDPDNAGVPQ